MLDYLNGLDWSNPWSAGGQYSSLCVYSVTQNYNFREELIKYSNKLVDKETGAYFNGKPSSSREVINGAMKIISGLDWLDIEIHNPKDLLTSVYQISPMQKGVTLLIIFMCFINVPNKAIIDKRYNENVMRFYYYLKN